MMGVMGAILIVSRFIQVPGSLNFFSFMENNPAFASPQINSMLQPGLIEIQVDGIDMGNVHLLDPPHSIEIDGFELIVGPQYLNKDEIWTANSSSNETFWLENSIINYVFRLPNGRGYHDLLEEAVASKSIIQLNTIQGNQLNFTLNQGKQQKSLIAKRYIQQIEPSITFIWVDGEDNEASYIVSGVYTPVVQDMEAYDLGTLRVQSDDNLTDSGSYLTVSLDGVENQENMIQILVRGMILNHGGNEYILEERDIDLSSLGLESQIISIDPPLPWHIPADNNQIPFTIIFQRPFESEAILTIGEDTFQLNNIR